MGQAAHPLAPFNAVDFSFVCACVSVCVCVCAMCLYMCVHACVCVFQCTSGGLELVSGISLSHFLLSF